MSDELSVTTTHVRELATKQTAIAAQISSATASPEGTGARMLLNHGVVCASTAAAVTMAEQLRSAACTAMATTSTGLQTKLTAAAAKYDATDTTAAENLGEQVHPS